MLEPYLMSFPGQYQCMVCWRSYCQQKVHQTSVENEEQAIHELKSCVLTTANRMKENKLKMSSFKTEFILFGSGQQPGKIHLQKQT